MMLQDRIQEANSMAEARSADVWANYWPAEFFTDYRPLGEIYDKLGRAQTPVASTKSSCQGNNGDIPH